MRKKQLEGTVIFIDKTAVIDGKPVELPAKEFDLLALLIENQGKALKKEYLFSTVWGSNSDSELLADGGIEYISCGSEKQ